MAQFNLRVSKDFLDKIKVESDLRGISRTELTHKAFEHFYICQKAEPLPTLKRIINAYPYTRCVCGSEIPIGQQCLWGKTESGTIYLCSDCEIKAETDKTIVKRIMKRRSLDREIRALRNMLDNLATEYEEGRHIENLLEIRELLKKEHSFFMQFSQGLAKWGAQEETRKVDQIISMLRKILGYTQDFETFYETKMKSKAQRGQIHA